MLKIENRNLRSALLLGAATASALSFYVPTPAAAEAELVVVTGSRIVNRDFSSDSPLTTVSGDTLKSTGSIEVTQLLSTLPQVVPGLSAGSNNPPSGGQQQVDLRGLGANRNIVLMDGRRVAPSNDDGTVDLQTIPTSMIERVEVITGGASAVYGPDAITGVVNFIMKNDFSGVAADAQYGISGKGDDDEKSFSLTLGGNFADGRGNLVLSYDYAYRRPIQDGARPFAAQATAVTSRSPTGTIVADSWTQAALDSVFGQAAYGSLAPGSVPTGERLSVNPNNTLFSLGGTGTSGVWNYQDNPLYPAKLFCANPASHSTCQTFSYNFQPPNLLIIPLQRQNFMANGHFDISPDITAYMSAKFTNYSSASSLAPTPAPTSPVKSPDGGASGSSYIVPSNNPFIPTDLKTLLNSRTSTNGLPYNGQAPTSANEDLLIRTRFLALGPRLDVQNNSIFQETFGVKGNLLGDMKFDLFASYGQLDNYDVQHGNVSNSAVEGLLFGQGCNGDSSGFSDFNIFGALKFGPNSLACVQRLTKNTTKTTFTNVEGSVTGTIGNHVLQGGDISFAVGADYREQTFAYLADPLLASGDVSGFNAGSSISGAVYDKEVFGELYFPIMKDRPFAESLSVTLGGRYTQQANTFHGNAFTYKAEADWTAIHGVTLRGSYEVATRMPNINELFSPSFQDNPALADPCNFDSPFRTGAHAVQVKALCIAQAAAAGGATFQQPNSQIQINSGGNPFLKPETANTFTVGVAVTSPFEDSPWLSGMSGTLDYWNIDLHSPIGIDSFDILYGCFNYDGSNPTYSNLNANCQKFTNGIGGLGKRTGSGVPYLSGFETNLTKNKLDGIDLALNWALDLHDTIDANPMWGRLNFAANGTWTDTFIVQGSPTGLAIDYAGTIGATSPIGLNTDAALPRFKAQLTTTWDLGDGSISLRTSWVDGMKNNLSRVGWTGLNFGVGKVGGVPGNIYLDLFGHYQLTQEIDLRGGILNLADTPPRIYNPSQQDGTDPSTYDVIGRRFFAGVGVKL